MKKRILILTFLISVVGCKNKEVHYVNPSANLFKKASDIFKRNPTDNDSLSYAIFLIDSAIKFEPKQINFMLTKCQIAMIMKKYDIVISTCNEIIKINDFNYNAFLLKGIAFELFNNKDSAIHNYKGALISLEKTKFKEKITKDYQRLILYNLLYDTANFNLQLNQFKNEYSRDKEFNSLYEDLKYFNRSEYVRSF